MPTDIKLDQVDGNWLLVEGNVLKATASDFMLDAPGRRRLGHAALLVVCGILQRLIQEGTDRLGSEDVGSLQEGSVGSGGSVRSGPQLTKQPEAASERFRHRPRLRRKLPRAFRQCQKRQGRR